jgi:glycosyltransferase involved in cell wall biosynthesis
MPAISVIVPVYNVEKYLCKCLDSILAQTFTDFERERNVKDLSIN